MSEPHLSPRQQKWMDSVRASLERETGKTLSEWVAIARTCPEAGHRARLKWLKDNHGLLQNRASHVLSETFPSKMTWREPAALIEALWVDPSSRAIFEAIDVRARALPGAIQTARKGYTAWTREFQFAALRPIKGGGAMVGLAIATSAEPTLEAPRNESWSERLKSRLPIASSQLISPRIEALLREAWERS
jgi:hypothetical protein